MQWQYYDFMGTIMNIFHKKEVISVREHHKKAKTVSKMSSQESDCI